jgi:hypothetical protein
MKALLAAVIDENTERLRIPDAVKAAADEFTAFFRKVQQQDVLSRACMGELSASA